MPTLVDILAIEAGYCCSYDLIRANRGYTSEKLAELLGVSRRTVTHYRTKVKRGELARCEDCPPAGSPHKPLRNRRVSGRNPAAGQ